MNVFTKSLVIPAALAAMVLMGLPAWASSNNEKAELTTRLNEATTTLRDIASPQRGIPTRVRSEAKCIAVVPRLMTAAVGIGGERGRGAVTCESNGKWSAPAFFTVSGGSIGAEIGAERTSVVLLALNDAGMNKFLGDKFELGASAGITLGTKAANTSDETWRKDIVTYSYSKGAFVGLDLNGATIRMDNNAMRAFYGTDITTAQVLKDQVPVPAQGQSFVAEAARVERGKAG